MAKNNVSNRPGYLYMDGNTESTYENDHEEVQGAITTLKIANDGANDLEFIINRASDSNKVDGVVKSGEVLNLADIDQGLSSVAVKGSVASAYRLWAYH